MRSRGGATGVAAAAGGVLWAVHAAVLAARPTGCVAEGCAAAGGQRETDDLAVGIVVNGVLVGDSPLWWLHETDSLGRFLPVLGGLAAGIAVLRRSMLPKWIGAVLIVTALLSLGFNAQNHRVLLTLPFGLAWVAAGYQASGHCASGALPDLASPGTPLRCSGGQATLLDEGLPHPDRQAYGRGARMESTSGGDGHGSTRW